MSAPSEPRNTDRDRGGQQMDQVPPGGQRPRAAQTARDQGEQEAGQHRLDERRGGQRRLAEQAPARRPAARTARPEPAPRSRPRGAGTPRPCRTTHRPASQSSAPGSSTRPSGSRPIRPPALAAPRPPACSVKPTWWPTSHRSAAVRSTPGRPRPACGAAIQPASTSRVISTSPLPAAAQAAMAPVITSGRAGPAAGPRRSGAAARPRGRRGRSGHNCPSWQAASGPSWRRAAAPPRGRRLAMGAAP